MLLGYSIVGLSCENGEKNIKELFVRYFVLFFMVLFVILGFVR